MGGLQKKFRDKKLKFVVDNSRKRLYDNLYEFQKLAYGMTAHFGNDEGGNTLAGN